MVFIFGGNQKKENQNRFLRETKKCRICSFGAENESGIGFAIDSVMQFEDAEWFDETGFSFTLAKCYENLLGNNWLRVYCVTFSVCVFVCFTTKQFLFVLLFLTYVVNRSRKTVTQDTGKRTQLSCLGVPA